MTQKTTFDASRKAGVERRKHKRFESTTGLFVVLGPNSPKVGRVIDVSLSGIAFRHVDEKAALDGGCKFDMFHVLNGFCLRKVPFEVIWDFESNKTSHSFMTIRETGIQFRTLTIYQKSQLEHLIENLTRK